MKRHSIFNERKINMVQWPSLVNEDTGYNHHSQYKEPLTKDKLSY